MIAVYRWRTADGKDTGMSNEATREWAEHRHEAEREVELRETGASCLHCGCAVTATNGVVTPEAAICDTCNGR
jgi:hypothetical protein